MVKTILGWCMLEPMLHVNSIFNYTFECNSQLPSAALVRILYWLEPLHHRLQLSLASTSRIWCIVFLGYGSSKLSSSIAPAVTRSQPVNKQYEWTELMTSCISIYSYISALLALDKDVYSAADILKIHRIRSAMATEIQLLAGFNQDWWFSDVVEIGLGAWLVIHWCQMLRPWWIMPW